MASFPGILFDNWPEPEPPLEEAGQSVDYNIFCPPLCFKSEQGISKKPTCAREDIPESADPSPPEEQGGESMVGGVMAPVVTPARP